MDLLSRIAGWLGKNQATIGAVVGVAVLAGIVFAGVRYLLPQRDEPSSETTSEEGPSSPCPSA